jgi:monofunctional chorismate mutase
MDLNDIRKEIDAVDDQVALLLKKRMRLVGEVAEYKKRTGTKITDSNREREILARICKGESAEALQKIFTAIIEVSKEEQQKISPD